MKRITKNIAIALLGMVIWTLSEETYAQCRVDNANPVQGEFSINGIQVKGDGGNSSTAPNNIPIKICEGELIKLKNTIVGTSPSASISYWIMPEANHRSTIPNPIPANPVGRTVGYTPPASADVDVKMDNSSPQGFSNYNTPGRYVIYQYDNTSTGTPDPFHYSCQVIEIIKPTTPNVQHDVCSDSKVILTFPADANNKYDDYNIQYILSPTYKPQEKTGKPASYPFKFKNVEDLSGYGSVDIEIKGLSATGGCLAPIFTISSVSLNTNTIIKPTLSAIVGATLKGEFKLAVSTANGVKRNVYMRDPSDPSQNNFNYTATPFKTYTSSAASGLDSNAVQVPNGDKVYCFQVEAVDGSCASSFVSNPALRSDELCTTTLEVRAENNQNVLRWSQAMGGGLIGANFVNYRIERFFPDGTFDKILNSTPNISDLTFTDSQVTCGQEYIYKVITRYPLNSVSQAVKVKATSSDVPPKIPFAFTTISNTGTNIRIQGQFDANNTPVNFKPDGFKYYRANSLNGTYSFLKSGNRFIEDLTADINKQSYCYYMTWTDLCNNESEKSDKMCSVFLKADGSNTKWTSENSHTLNTDSYIVQRVNPATNTNIKELASNLIGINSFETKSLDESEGQEIYVQIESRPKDWQIGGVNALPPTLSNIIRIFRPSFSMTPQIFTPNGDSVNDKFLVRGKFIKKLKMTIYDRWGNVIYYEDTENFPLEVNQTDSNVVGWNGIMNNGNKASEGSYAYKIEIEDTIGQVTTKEGALLLAY
jgi:gliding motility-associated-like protein